VNRRLVALLLWSCVRLGNNRQKLYRSCLPGRLGEIGISYALLRLDSTY